MSGDRNAEIWSTRLQKELLALTTSGKDDDANHQLPSFIAFQSHELDIGAGLCKVSFSIDVVNPNTPTVAQLPPAVAEGDSEQTTPNSPTATEGGEVVTEEETPESGTTSDATPEDDDKLVIMLDASLMRKPDKSIDAHAPAYPFQPPRAFLVTGATRFPSGSTISNGNPLDIDCDWTPSLHLTDAIVNIGLKLKESILQGEPTHSSKSKSDAADDPVEELVQGARRIGNFLSNKARGITHSISEASASTRAAVTPKKPRVKPEKKKATATEIHIGDEINLLEAPWVDCQGLYSCKAIRRSGFIEDAITTASQRIGTGGTNVGGNPQVAGAGFAGAAGVLRSITKSAKSLVEESFLMITDSHIVELRSSKLNLSIGTVTFAIPIDMMAKLKFRREESISLFFKVAPDDPLILMCPDSADAVTQIQHVLKAHGVKGKHTNAATQRAIHEALQLVQEIQAKERALEYQPSVDRVNEIMDLYRQAAERFEVAGDVRHEEVVSHMRKFLAQPLAASILDGSFKPDPIPEPKPKDPSVIPQGEVLESSREQKDDDEEEDPSGKKGPTDDQDFEKNIDNLVEEAKDLTNLSLGPGEDIDDILKESGTGASGGIDDLDAMLNAADKELEELMAS